ncbi:MAG: ribosomal protein S18-alanine N-acetyltransferase [Anaerolineae bacterium]|nr:ribosomal protein S18-alanine N-acetyltransferase [Gemmatimonadaceae bacterium]
MTQEFMERKTNPWIRPAAPGDIDQIMEIEQASFSDPWQRRSLVSLIGNSRVFFAVAEGEAARILGYVTAWFVLNEGEIGNLAVDPQWRSLGIGSALLDEVVSHSVEHGIETLYLEVRDSNTPARRLYASRGFVEIGRRKRYYRQPVEDAIVLQCRTVTRR